jgi:transposase InsO family protein
MSLARTQFTGQLVKWLIAKVRHGDWGEHIGRARCYQVRKLYDAHSWKVKRLRRNRFAPRVLDAADVAAAIAKDDEAAEEEEEEGSQSDDEDGAVSDSDSEADDPVGLAANGVPDSAKESVLFVKGLTRSAIQVAPSGQRRPIATWFEVVPENRVDAVLGSLWRPDGIQASAAKLYALTCERFVGISHADCAGFVAQQQSKQLSSSNAAQDKILAPSQPTDVGQRWELDLTFTDSTIPSDGFIGFMSTIDSLSRYLWCTAIASKSAAGIAHAFEVLFKTFGAPQKLQLDSSLENRSSTVKLLCQRYGVALVFTKPHVSSQNGGVERVHRSIKDKLRIAVLDLAREGEKVDFTELLESCVSSYNRQQQHSVTKLTPFEIFYGRSARQPGAVLVTARDGPAPARRAGSAGRAGSVAGQSLVTRVSAGRRAAVELRDLRGASTTDISGPRNRKAPSMASGIERLPLRDERPRLLSKMSPLEAARERLGIRGSASSEDLRRRKSCPALQALRRGQAQEQEQEQKQEQEQFPPMQSAWCKASSPSASMSETIACCTE